MSNILEHGWYSKFIKTKVLYYIYSRQSIQWNIILIINWIILDVSYILYIIRYLGYCSWNLCGYLFWNFWEILLITCFNAFSNLFNDFLVNLPPGLKNLIFKVDLNLNKRRNPNWLWNQEWMFLNRVASKNLRRFLEKAAVT